MPNANASTTTYHCSICGADVVGFGAYGVHRQGHKREAAGTAPAATIGRQRKRSRIEDATPTAGGRDPSPPPAAGAGSSGNDPIPVDDGPAGPPPGRPARPSIASPRVTVGNDERARSVDEAIRDALPMQTVADIVRSLSAAISAADGAGPAGELSEVQAAQVAALIYDSTIGTVVHRFGGDVNRFKAGLAAIIIVVAKGGVHARAIAARAESRRIARAEAVAAADVAAASADIANGHVDDAIARAMRLQAERMQPAVPSGALD